MRNMLLTYVPNAIGGKPWKKNKMSGREVHMSYLYGHIPNSSRMARFGMSLLPGYNIFIAWGYISNLFNSGK